MRLDFSRWPPHPNDEIEQWFDSRLPWSGQILTEDCRRSFIWRR